MIDIDCAEKLLDFGRRIGDGHRAREQLEGAVALHNMLETHGVAYLADEVGMGKTYVALGVLALYRHFNPNFRALVIAPRNNIQRKWQNELRNLVAHNLRFSDLRVRSLDGAPARAMVSCSNLTGLVREVGVNPDRDFFVRMPSFSVNLKDQEESQRRLRDSLRRELPWLPKSAFGRGGRHDKRDFKDRLACAMCCAMPDFDLVIVDEAHNLKHGFGPRVSARNRVMGLLFGHSEPGLDVSPFKGYGRRARRVLFLSATPVDDDYGQLWNQLHVFDRGRQFTGLREPGSDDEKKLIARSFLVRRVTVMHVDGRPYTKNQYRREWRRGGVETHDQPLQIRDQRQRLIVALMQKKVSELLGRERFGASFQIGMLASFESFLETCQGRAKQPAEAETETEADANFDDLEQTDEARERRGIDVSAIDAIARSHRATFHEELPHPKMDGLVDELGGAWRRGQKALIFVRRVRSVVEIKRRLDDLYDRWLLDTLRRRMPAATISRLDSAYKRFLARKEQARDESSDSIAGSREDGDVDTFFAYFFRGDGPRGIVSGATIQGRFTSQGSIYATFFEDNHVAWLLDARPGQVLEALAERLGRPRDELTRDIAERGLHFLSRAKRVQRKPGFVAAQAAAVELLVEHTDDARARAVWHALYQPQRELRSRVASEPNLARWLETPTFFSELRQRPELRDALWPAPRGARPELAFREQEQRAQLLATAARLGHAFIDLYIVAIKELGTADPGKHADREANLADAEMTGIRRYLDQLEQSRADPTGEFAAFHELAAIADNFELLVDVNLSEARTANLAETAASFSKLLRRQQPVGGMTGGSLNQTLIRQFRMPGYPFVLIATDVLQEGEDLHTFCSRVYHYGISWTPSSMEQRTGRVDRVRSQTDRRLSQLSGGVQSADKLQVYYPHLCDSVESLQVRRVLQRMDRFLRLMHEGLAAPTTDERSLQVDREILQGLVYPEPIEERLRTAFDIPRDTLVGEVKALVCDEAQALECRARLRALRREALGGLPIRWEEDTEDGPLLGTASVGQRVQPFALLLRSVGAHTSVRCISPIGHTNVEHGDMQAIVGHAARLRAPVAAVIGREEGSYDLTVEDETLLGQRELDARRVGLLVHRIVTAADGLERALLETQDAPMQQFERDLRKEGAGHG
jgi:hypothetical protein